MNEYKRCLGLPVDRICVAVLGKEPLELRRSCSIVGLGITTNWALSEHADWSILELPNIFRR